MPTLHEPRLPSVADIEETLKLEPRHFGALSGLGLIYQEVEKWDAALRAFETALQVNPSGLWGRFYDVPSGDGGVILSNAFLTYTSATNYFAGKTPALIASRSRSTA